MLRKFCTYTKPSLRSHIDLVMNNKIKDKFNLVENGVKYIDAKLWPVEEIIETTNSLKKENYFVMSCKVFKTMRISKLGDKNDLAQHIFAVKN